MPRRRVLVVLAFTLACAARPGAVATSPAGDEDARAVALAQEYARAYYDAFPEEGTLVGYPRADPARLHDGALSALRAWETREDRFLEQARALAAQVRSHRARLAIAIVQADLEARVALRGCHYELWNVSAQWGWQQALAGVAAVQAVATPADRGAALARARAIPALLDSEIARLRAGLGTGPVATADNVRAVIAEMDELLAGSPEATPFFLPALRADDPAFRVALAETISREVFPAMRTYRAFLADAYLPRAPDQLVLPPGCYRAALLRATGAALDPEALHELGLRELARVDDERRSFARRAFGAEDPDALRERLRKDPAFALPTPADILGSIRATVDRARAALPRWFEVLPRAGVVVEPIPAFEARFLSPHYQAGSADGAHPGIFRVGAAPSRGATSFSLQPLTFHEAVPGHHLQIALALENPEALDVARYSSFIGDAAVEGWALYAEGLAEEMGLYSGPEARLQRLQSERFRAARVVVDTGLHAKGWSRRRAIEFLVALGVSEAVAAAEVDRYVALPGQATAYLYGLLEIRSMRRAAEGRLGSRFDVRAFHARLLEDGLVPLPFLREKIARWASSAAPATPAPPAPRGA